MSDLRTGLIVGGTVVGICILLKAIPLLVLGGIVYLLYLATKNENSSTAKESTQECKTGDPKK